MESNFELCEFVDKSRLQSLINSGLLKEEWTQEDRDKKHKWFNTTHFRGELEALQNYYNRLDDNGMTIITYKRDANQGRYKLPNCLSSMRRIYRNYLLHDKYYDFDMVNSCGTIIHYLAEKHNLTDKINTIIKYNKNRQKWINDIIKVFKLKYEEAKQIMTSLTFGATYYDCEKKSGIIFKYGLVEKYKSYQCQPGHIFYELKSYSSNIQTIASELIKLGIYFIHTEKGILSWLAKLVQTIETEIVTSLKTYVSQNYPQLVYNEFSELPNAIYELDGIKLSKENVDNFGGPNAVIGIFYEWLSENSYNQISFINKSMDERIDLDNPQINIEQPQIIVEQPQPQPSPITITQTFSPIVITSEEKFMIPVEILYLGCNDIARFVAPKLSEIMKYSRILEIWIVYNEHTHFWEKIKKPEATLSTFLQKATNNTRQYLVNKQTLNLSSGKQSDGHIEKELRTSSDWYSCFSQKSYLSMIKDFLTTYICDDEFINRLDDNKYQLTFQNGILDLKTMKFRNGLFKEDYLTKCIPCDYVKPTKDQMNEVKRELLKICNNNDSHLKYYLSLIGYSLTADSDKEQIFGYFRGQSASNGKSVIFEVLEEIMPNYIKKADNKIFDVNFDMKKELPSFYGKRLIWVNELSELKKDSDRLKALSDGTTYSFGRNYAVESEILNVLFKIIIVSNYSLNIKADNGVVRRFKLCQFNSKFDEKYTQDNYERLEFKKDKNFATKLRTDLKMALIELLAQYGNYYWNEKNLKSYPDEWNEEAMENMNDNNKFDTWFNENFTTDLLEIKEGEKGLFVGKQFMTEMLPSNLQNVKINDELKRMRINFTYEKTRRYRTNKGVYVGFGLKKQDQENEN